MSPIKGSIQALARLLRQHPWYVAFALLYGLTLLPGLGWHIPCLFRSLFDINCPACGMARGLSALIQGDFSAAWHHSPQLLLIIPIGTSWFIYQWYRIYHQIVHANSVP